MRVAIIGSRNHKNLTVADIQRQLPENCSCMISGGAQGVDSLAEEAANRANIPIVKILPDYESFGKAAPLIRNREIVRQADLILAFWDTHSRGTAGTLAQCIKQRKPFRIFLLEDCFGKGANHNGE